MPCFKCQGTGQSSKRDKITRKVIKSDCSVCHGIAPASFALSTSSIPKRRLKRGLVCPFRQPDWIPSPPFSLKKIHEAAALLEQDEMLTSLCGDWSIFQLTTGHRYTTDDLATASIAIKTARTFSPKTHLDIGCGLGSVLQFCAYSLHSILESSVGIEAQAAHVKLARRSITINGIASKTTVIHADLRDFTSYTSSNLFDPTTHLSSKFDLVTGTPPYFPTSTGVLPRVANRGKCSFEIRGGIEVYAAAASKTLAPHGRFIVCQTSIEIQRSETAIRLVGLEVIERWDFHGKEGKRALFVVFVCGWSKEVGREMIVHDVDVRDKQGEYTEEWMDIMERVGKPRPK